MNGVSEEWISNVHLYGEWSYQSTFATREEAIEDGREQYRDALDGKGSELFDDVDEEELKNIKSFYVARVKEFVPIVDVRRVLERIQEDAWEYCTYGEDYLSDVSDSQVEDLRKSLQKAFDDWMNRTGNKPTFSNCVCPEEVPIDPKALALGNMSEPAGVGRMCYDCKWMNYENMWCEHTMRSVPLTSSIPPRGCMTYQAGLGNFESKEHGEHERPMG